MNAKRACELTKQNEHYFVVYNRIIEIIKEHVKYSHNNEIELGYDVHKHNYLITLGGETLINQYVSGGQIHYIPDETKKMLENDGYEVIINRNEIINLTKQTLVEKTKKVPAKFLFWKYEKTVYYKSIVTEYLPETATSIVVKWCCKNE